MNNRFCLFREMVVLRECPNSIRFFCVNTGCLDHRVRLGFILGRSWEQWLLDTVIHWRSFGVIWLLNTCNYLSFRRVVRAECQQIVTSLLWPLQVAEPSGGIDFRLKLLPPAPDGLRSLFSFDCKLSIKVKWINTVVLPVSPYFNTC